MANWPIERRWRILFPENVREELTTRRLADQQACCLLGASGLGKTFELNRLEALDREAGRVSPGTFRLAQPADGLRAGLRDVAAGRGPDLALHLDALDEAMAHNAWAEDQLAAWIRQDAGDMPPFLRVTCRSTVRPKAVEAAMRATYGEISVYVASLQPLSDDDIANVARSEGVDPAAFVEEVRRSKAELLASQPLTLVMLLGHFRHHKRLPERRCDLFEQAVRRLAGERQERRAKRTASSFGAARIEAAAERLACLAVLSGRDGVDLTDDPEADCLRLDELERLPGHDFRLEDDLLRAVELSGLCDGVTADRFRFFHLQIAEYLAGRQIARLSLHQAKALLSSRVETRISIAAPLRETAAFAAMMNPELARWLADIDPEVVGLSDVADDGVRRHAVLELMKHYRGHELTDAMELGGRTELAGLEYQDVAQDLVPAMRERGAQCEDVLDFVISLIRSWKLSCLHPDLADLMLDSSVPLRTRIYAGYVLRETAKPEILRRLRPLLRGSPEDPGRELKGIALDCLWPGDLSEAELLSFLEPWHDQKLIGSFIAFLERLNAEGFAAAGCRCIGLEWAVRCLVSGATWSPTFRLIQRIAHGALDDVEDPKTARELVRLLLQAGDRRSRLIFGVIVDPDVTLDERNGPPAALESPKVRRILLARLAQDGEADAIRSAKLQANNLLRHEDYSWLLVNAVDPGRPPRERETFILLASMLPPPESPECLETWFHLREQEPIRSMVTYRLSTPLDSVDAREGRRAYRLAARLGSEYVKTERGSQAARVANFLTEFPPDDPTLFPRLCHELTRTEWDDYRDPRRSTFPTQTLGWLVASPELRGRIVAAARRYLSGFAKSAGASSSRPDRPLPEGFMPAIWLLIEQDRAWLETTPTGFWMKWSPLILAALQTRLLGQPRGVEKALFDYLHRRVPDQVRRSLMSGATAAESRGRDFLPELIELAEGVEDDELDASLLEQLRKGGIPIGRVGILTRFLLLRNPRRVVDGLRAVLHVRNDATDEGSAIEIASALLSEPSRETWGLALGTLRERPELARPTLGKYAIGGQSWDPNKAMNVQSVSPSQLGELIELLFDCHPPESDPEYEEAKWLTEMDAAPVLRDRLIMDLRMAKGFDSVKVLRNLESKFGERVPWLRRPRSLAEREFRRSGWSPIPPATVAALLESSERRLIRSEDDALEGIVEAIRQYELSLRQSSPSPLEDLWNVPRTGKPSPKSEERISDKLCAAVRRYFSERAVAADREVQIRRRLISEDQDGQPGSRLDVLVTVPAVGTEVGEAVTIPIEVKRSDNREAKTGLVDQLVDRYMSELGASRGVFVVVWLDAPGMTKNRPVWKSREAAVQALERQAAEVRGKVGETRRVEALVIDASLS